MHDERAIPDDLLELLEAKRKELESVAQFRALKAGKRGTADLVASEAVSGRLDEQTFLAAVAMKNQDDSRPKGPSRRQRPKVNARKRQRQARRRQR